MAEQRYPKVNEHTLEEERQDAAFYGNPYWHELCELAAVGYLVKKMGLDNPELLAKEIAALMEKQKERGFKV